MGTLAQVAGRANLFTNRTAEPALPTSASDGTAMPAAVAAPPTLITAVEMAANGGNCTLTGPVNLYGYRKGSEKWSLLGELNKGGNITLVDGGVGYSEPVQFLATFSRVEVRSQGISANGYDVDLQNIDVME